jgi:hypothetical protein
MTAHVLHSCTDERCQICIGGLSLCNVCGGAEGSLPTECPGVRMTEQQEELVYAGVLNFIDGQWNRAVLQ